MSNEQSELDLREASLPPIDAAGESTKPALMKDLPSVDPPSAGFIVQLFVIPAIIVMAVLGVWLLFGQLATGELDWRKSVANIKSENPHIRWRAAATLSDMLNADAAKGDKGQRLAENFEIARVICDIYADLLSQRQFTEEEREQLEFLSKAVGRLNVPEIVNPVLVIALKHEDQDIQRQALVALAMIAGERPEQHRTFDNESIIEAVTNLSHSETPVIRHLAVYVLGLSGAETVQPRLTALLSHGDLNTRLNAAIGLARQGSTAGMPIFEQVIEDAISNPPADPGRGATAEKSEVYSQSLVVLKNTINAVDRLKDSLSEEERGAWADRLKRFADKCDNDVIRLLALEVRERL